LPAWYIMKIDSMDKVQKIREEVVRLKSQLLRGACSSQIAMETRCKEEAYDEVLTLLDSMQEELKTDWLQELHCKLDSLSKEDFEKVWAKYAQKEEPVSEDLEKEIEQYCLRHGYLNSFKDCGYTFNEQVGDIARHFANWQKQQMMKDAFDFTKEHNTACVLASECLRGNGWFSRERDFNDLFRHLSCVDELFEGKFSGKTKVIVIKED